MDGQQVDYLTKLREALTRVLVAAHYVDELDEARAIVERHTFAGAADPGGWWPEADVIVHTEGNGIPNDEDTEFWAEVDAELIRMGIQQFYCQPVNQVVIGFEHDPEAIIREPQPPRVFAKYPHLKLVR